MKRKNITVGIPVFNEASNIKKLVESILGQKNDNFNLVKLLIMIDGSTDGSDKIAQDLADKDGRISVINDGARIGKPQRLNQMFRLVKEELLVVFDGDIILEGETVIDSLVEKFVHPNVGVVSGRARPVEGGGWWRKATVKEAENWLLIREKVRSGDNVHNLSGCIFALNRNYFKELFIPNGVVADDEFIYLESKRQGFRFRYAPKAGVFYLTPGTREDFLIQASRSISGKQNLAAYFGDDIEKYYQISGFTKAGVILKSFLSDPIVTILSLWLEAEVRIRNMIGQTGEIKDLWTRINSSKR